MARRSKQRFVRLYRCLKISLYEKPATQPDSKTLTSYPLDSICLPSHTGSLSSTIPSPPLSLPVDSNRPPIQVSSHQIFLYQTGQEYPIQPTPDERIDPPLGADPMPSRQLSVYRMRRA